MTQAIEMPDLEALKVAYHDARQALREANTAFTALSLARTTYRDAALEASGFKGCVAEFTRNNRWGAEKRTDVLRFLVTRLGSYNEDYIGGYMIRANGTVGTRSLECLISEAKNLGAYVPPVAKAEGRS